MPNPQKRPPFLYTFAARHRKPADTAVAVRVDALVPFVHAQSRAGPRGPFPQPGADRKANTDRPLGALLPRPEKARKSAPLFSGATNAVRGGHVLVNRPCRSGPPTPAGASEHEGGCAESPKACEAHRACAS